MTYKLVRVPKEPKTLEELAANLFEALDCRGGHAMLYIQVALKSAHALGSMETEEPCRRCKDPSCYGWREGNWTCAIEEKRLKFSALAAGLRDVVREVKKDPK